MSDFRARVVLLGASNVTKGISVIIKTAQNLLGAPLDVYAAIGHGRSYGMTSFVLVRSLTSVVDARLWNVLEQQPLETPTYALIADVGNDVMYGVQPERIVHWVQQCVQRLQAMNARIVMASLPMQRIARLSQPHYLIARTLLFPTNRMTYDQVQQRAYETVHRLEELAASSGIALVELPAAWYGIDPIHIRASRMSEAWRQVLAHWADDDVQPPLATGSLRRWLRLRTLSPEQWWLLGMQRGRAQPSATLADGSRISLY